MCVHAIKVTFKKFEGEFSLCGVINKYIPVVSQLHVYNLVCSLNTVAGYHCIHVCIKRQWPGPD
jgi:hypothetical protein